MKNASKSEIKRGQAISFRVPSDTPEHLLKHLQKLKETERRNFSSKIAEFVMEGVGNSYSRERETVTIPLPHRLTKVQRNWLKHEHSEALLGNIIYHLLSDPVRTTSLLASLNSNASDIDEALYLQEETPFDEDNRTVSDELGNLELHAETAAAADLTEMDDDLDNFDWEKAKQNQPQQADEEDKGEVENNLDDLLGDFLASMNK